jgi:hypothetical protein
MDPTHCLKIHNIDSLLHITRGIEAQCESVNQTTDEVQLDSPKDKTIKFQWQTFHLLQKQVWYVA